MQSHCGQLNGPYLWLPKVLTLPALVLVYVCSIMYIYAIAYYYCSYRLNLILFTVFMALILLAIELYNVRTTFWQGDMSCMWDWLIDWFILLLWAMYGIQCADVSTAYSTSDRVCWCLWLLSHTLTCISCNAIRAYWIVTLTSIQWNGVLL